jgi:dTDP-L-rhamnose 4-epimerase
MQDATIITGGAGFIGCRLSEVLGSRSSKIVAIDNLHPQVHRLGERPRDLHDDVELVVDDVSDASAWDELLKRYHPRTVVHLAAETGTAQSLMESSRHARVNVLGTTQMLDAFTRADVRPEHIVLSSSRAVYGEGAWQSDSGDVFYPALRSHEQLEKQAWDFVYGSSVARALPHRASQVFPNPSSIYGATKLAQENILGAWCGAMKVPVSFLRFQNVYGPGQSPFNPYTGIINVFHRVAYSGGEIDVYEDGQIGRDFVFIDDVVRAVVAAIDQPPAERRVLDVGTGTATTIVEAAHRIAALHKAPRPKISGKFRDGDIRWAVADRQDLYNDLGVVCDVDFMEHGAELVGRWLVDNGYMT